MINRRRDAAVKASDTPDCAKDMQLLLAVPSVRSVVHTRRMRTFHATVAMSILLAGLSGCAAYDPPVQGDHTAEKYKTDLAACRTTSRETVRRKNAATPQSWIISPITGPPEVRAAIRTCMVGKGYVLQKTND